MYEYRCQCGVFELIRTMSECSEEGKCPTCGRMAPRKYSIFHDIWGWILTEKSHHKGAKDTWVQNRPSNGQIVDDNKAPRVKTIF